MVEKKKATSTTATLDRLKASGQLAALARKKPAGASGGGALEVALDKIIPDPEQPRRSFDHDKLISLSETIKVQGVLQPITVRPANEDGIHVIIMGERRWRASGLAGLGTIPVLIKEETPELRMAQLTENVQRDDLTTFEVARAVAALRDAGQSRDDVAVALGWSQSMVSRFTTIAKMPDEFQELAQANVPPRALSDLYALWDRDEEAVRDFIATVKASDVSRTSVEKLRSQLDGVSSAGQGGDGVPSPVASGSAAEGGEADLHGDLPPEEGGQSEQGSPNAGGRKKARGVALICKVGEDVGRIDTSTVADAPGCVVVRFDNGERIEDVALERIQLIDAVPLE